MKYLPAILALFLCGSIKAQKDTMKSIYKDLPVLKFYTISTETVTENGATVYKAGGKTIDKATYDKYNDSRKTFMQCKPCIMETYDNNNLLSSRAIKYTDCPVGYWLNYYPS